MGILSTLTKRFSRKHRAKQKSGLGATWSGPGGGFQGGKLNRMTEQWNPGEHGPQANHRLDGQRLRDRARDLYNNNPIAKAAVDAFVANVVESGIAPKPKLIATEERKTWSDAWNLWGGLTAHATREADITADSTINELMRLWLTEVIVAGGCLTYYRTLRRRGRLLPLSIELIPEERFAEHLDRFPANSKRSNPVINGIEIDNSTGRTVAYHVTRQLNDAGAYDPLDTVRLPAHRCEYAFIKGRIGQKRGTTWLHAALEWIWALGYYTDNELKNSDVKSQMAIMILTKASEDGYEFDDIIDSSPDGATTDAHGNTLEKWGNQQIFRGYPGDDIKGIGPNVPGSDSMPWIHLIQRSIATATGQTYEEVTGDYSKGNFSSTRASMQSARKRYRPVQQFAVNHFGNPTYRRFADSAVGSLLEGFPAPATYRERRGEFLKVTWATPRWESVNPKEDALADDIMLKNGTKTRAEIVEGKGGDMEEHADQLLREKEMFEERDLNFETADPQGETIDFQQVQPGQGDDD